MTLTDIRTAKAEAAAAVGKPGPRWEYRTRINCAAGDATGTGCATAAAACTNGQFQAVVLRRLVDERGVPINDERGIWTEWGLTCFPQELPGSNLPTLAMIRQAFRDIDFAKGSVSLQPVGNVTLVNLPTFFEASWPAAGVAPEEIDTSALLGYRLEIQPVLQSLTYVYGDGSTSEPTQSLGGPHPTGDIRWTYRRAGQVDTRVDTSYGGRFRLEGGSWVTIPDTVTVQGTPVTLTVREAKARLYQ
ncbi:hypothetical protein N798_13195 [Knoellia flava TL1]|uniref:Uncharacterized protein n=2 Tax=Knoellia flava TaxID=913969 RepID=A0A8H9FTM3_9MICO|nr:hypothetical protein [Knoellia flava]KGN29492.1 hypothetical protein N798_13195 [Knoellia flava TL1]GGB76046.1 hypothetical protein GCM10011314_14520 [Knoellia flava]